MKKENKKLAYKDLDYDRLPKHFFLIVDDHLLEISNHKDLDSDWEISGDTLQQKLRSARDLDVLPSTTTIYVDTDGIFDLDVISDNAKLITAEEAFEEMDEEEKDGWESYAEYCADL